MLSFCCRYFYDFEFLGHGTIGLMQDSDSSARTSLVRSRGRDRCFDVSLETYSTVQKITYSEGLQSIAANFIAAYKSPIIMLQGEDLGSCDRGVSHDGNSDPSIISLNDPPTLNISSFHDTLSIIPYQ